MDRFKKEEQLFFVVFSNSVSAHSTILNSTPTDEETVQEQLSVIDMQISQFPRVAMML